MKYALMSLLACCHATAYTQKVENLPAKGSSAPIENVAIEKIASDSLCSAFVIWIKSGVKHHLHESHTENIYVIEGEGTMEFNDTSFVLRAGDYVLIPKGTVHAVMAHKPMKVLSIQTPEWKTEDRKFVEPIRRPHNE